LIIVLKKLVAALNFFEPLAKKNWSSQDYGNQKLFQSP
jgi:hypothetical protein